MDTRPMTTAAALISLYDDLAKSTMPSDLVADIVRAAACNLTEHGNLTVTPGGAA